MGNSPSAARPLSSPPPSPALAPASDPKALPLHHYLRHGPVRRKRSTILSALTLGCVSDPLPSDYSPPPSPRPSLLEKHSYEQPPPVYASTSDLLEDDAANAAFKTFISEYPEYYLTWTLDALRRSDFSRLDHVGEAYVDYMGGSLYPNSLVRVHTNFLNRNVLGNTHSVNNSSRLSATHAAAARKAVLSFFNAPPDYTVVFTANASAALKLVGESFPFSPDGCYILGADSHNSVHGIRQFAIQRGAQVHYIESTSTGGMDVADALNTLSRHHHPDHPAPSLFALTGQSNVSNAKNPLVLIKHAASMGYYTLLDAAALAPTSVISLSETPVDAMAISFYKMFGFPTGVGALIVKKSFLEKLRRPWFAGGTVDVVQAPGTIFTLTSEINEQFEDGTINYLNLPAITDGLRFLSAYLPFLPLRLNILTHYLINSLKEFRYETTNTPVVRVLSRIPSRRLRSIGEQSDTGSVISLIFLAPTEGMLPLSFIEYAAAAQNISLRTGCMCNPGGAAALLGLREDMDRLYCGVTMKQFEQHVGHELGVVRISLGLATNFQDVFRVLRFVAAISRKADLEEMWNAWSDGRASPDAASHASV
ncbi:PLP-dependent transferase [Irpex rosettiformis]|uniref:PLP-dependent transferase n=1 Tax=Irpex rosettiformis TaxID=378272 RepID=A0ACB8U8U3_9APHY|nr:PLP-dependent transferase [Irpex rosettiformis]